MTIRALLFVLLCAGLTGASNLLLRQGLQSAGGFQLTGSALCALIRSPGFVGGLFLYGAAAVVWFYIVSFAPLTVAYPTLVGLAFFFVTLGAMVFFQEDVSWLKAAGMTLILSGILLTVRS